MKIEPRPKEAWLFLCIHKYQMSKEPLPKHVVEHVERTQNQTSHPRLHPIKHPVKEDKPDPVPEPDDEFEGDEPERIKRQYNRKKDNA